jgi:aminopeptidase N
MGHPIFRVTQDYDATKKMLTLKVRQEQRPDPESDYPQVTFFQTPVQVEIGTATSNRVERVQLAAREEQSFSFAVESEPLLVNFDYGSTLIKELIFNKTNGQLLYQLANDPDVLGRIWALRELATRLGNDRASASDRGVIIKALAGTATKDRFWGTRLEAANALNGIKEARDALLLAAKDPDARVRARAVNSLASTKDASLAATYEQMLTDQSYATIRAAAQALGQTHSGQAFDALVKLLSTPSWRDTIRASGLLGLAALGDARGLEIGLKYQGAPNPTAVRGAALSLIAATGKDDPRTLAIVTSAMKESFDQRNISLMTAAGEALVSLGDERGLVTLQELRKKAINFQNLAELIAEYEARLRGKVSAAKTKS